MRKDLGCIALVCVVALACITASYGAAHAQCPVVTQYTVVELPSPTTLDVRATGINNAAKVSGHYLDWSLADRAIRWDSPSQSVVLSGTGKAFAIADNGSVAGQTTTQNGTRAARWNASNALTILNPISRGTASIAKGVNQNDLTVGYSTNGSGHLVATYWQPSAAKDLTSKMNPKPVDSAAMGVNNSGVVVGWATYSSGVRRAVSWIGTTATLLPQYANADTAIAISSDGRVAGSGLPSSGPAIGHTLLWSGGQVSDLGAYQSTFQTQGNGVNACGTVVGDALVSDEYANIHVALIWQNGGGMTELGSLLPVGSGWTLFVASGINDAGQIAGWGTRDGLSGTHAFLLTPVVP